MNPFNRVLLTGLALMLLAVGMPRACGCRSQAQRIDRVEAATAGVRAAVEEYCTATGTAGALLGWGGTAPVGITILCPAGVEELEESYAQETEPTPAVSRRGAEGRGA